MKKDNDHIMNPKHAWTLTNKFRNWTQPPLKLLNGTIKEGMKVLDFGCGNGYMTIPIANAIGPKGKVIAVDLQKEMLERLKENTEQLDFADRIEFHLCKPEAVNLNEKVDTIVTCYVLHEVPNQKVTLQDFYNLLEKDGVFYLIEPPFHVTKKEFTSSITKACEVGFKLLERKRIGLNHVALFNKK